MSIDKDEPATLDLNDLPMDVFELADRGLTVESLTAGHGMTKFEGRADVCCDVCCQSSRTP
jgi:hypothetical protein